MLPQRSHFQKLEIMVLRPDFLFKSLQIFSQNDYFLQKSSFMILKAFMTRTTNMIYDGRDDAKHEKSVYDEYVKDMLFPRI